MIQKNRRRVTPIPFVDGTCEVFTAEKRTAVASLGKFDFREETVGVKAYAEFQVLGIQVDKAISIPYNTLVETGRLVKLNDESEFYRITLIQLKDSFPKSLRLTLTKTNIKWNEEVANDQIQSDTEDV